MYALWFLLLLVGVGLSSHLKSEYLRRHPHLRGRRPLYFLVLAAPTLAIGVMFARLHWHRVTQLHSHLWDPVITFHLLVWICVAIMASALAFSLAQILLAHVLVMRYPRATDPALLSLASRVAARLDLRCPTLHVCESSRPVALTGGLTRASRYVLLSSWTISNMDEEEMEAILTHELAHIRQRDQLTVWLGQLIRNFTFYLPASRRAWQRWLMSLEMARDRLVVEMTGRPLVLADALLKSAVQDLDTKATRNWPPGIGLTGNSQGQYILERVEALAGRTQATTGRGSIGAARFGTARIVFMIVLEALALSFLAPRLCCAWG